MQDPTNPRKFNYRIASFLVNYRYLFLVLFLACSAAAVFYSTRVNFTHEIDIWFLEDDAQVGNYNWYKRTFPSDEFVILAFETKNPFAPRDQATIKQLSDELEKMVIKRYPGVWRQVVDGINIPLSGDKLPPWKPIYRVISFTTVKHAVNRWIVDDEADPITIGPKNRFWIDEPDESDNWVQEFKVGKFVVRSARTDSEARYLLKRALANKRLRSSLISKEGDFVAVIGVVHKDFEEFWHKKQLADKVDKLVARVNKQRSVRLRSAGMFLFGVEFERLNVRDRNYMLPITLGMIILMLLLIFRRPAGVFIPALVMFVSVGWVRGFMGVFGIDDNVVGGMLAPLLIAVGIADSVHYYAEYRHYLSKVGKREAVIQATASVLKPCFFTSLTTSFGFASLMTSSLLPMRQFGLLASVGVVMAFVLSTLALPIFLDLLREPKEKPAIPGDPGRSISGFLKLMDRLAAFTRTWPKLIFFVSLFAVVASFFGIYKVNLETNDLEFIKKSNARRIDLDIVSEQFGGVSPIELVFDTHRINGVKDPKFLKKLDKLHSFLFKEVAETQQVTSIIDFIKEFRGTYMGGASTEYRIPATRQEVGQLLTQLEGDSGQLADYVDFNYRFARVSIKTKVLGSHAVDKLLTRVSKKLVELGFSHNKSLIKIPGSGEAPTKSDDKATQFIFTGLISLFIKMENYLLSSQIRSFSLALLVILILMMIQLRSVVLGLLSMIPNIFPLFLYLAVMGGAGINLDVGTAMISSIAIGISVDDTIHFMERHARKVRQEGRNYEQATAESLAESGLPIVMTSMILLLGFLTLVFGSFVPTIHFGILTAITIVGALFADLFLLPVVLTWLKPYKVKPKG